MTGGVSPRGGFLTHHTSPTRLASRGTLPRKRVREKLYRHFRSAADDGGSIGAQESKGERDLYVEPQLRGRGAGRAIITHLSDIGRRSGWLKIYWMTQAGNDKAHALYGKLAQRSSMVRYDLHLNEY